MICRRCARDFPERLMNELEQGPPPRSEWMCPLCALLEINKQFGLPEDTPFRGPKARALHADALTHLRATGQLKEGGNTP